MAQKILRHDEALVADAHHPTRPTRHTPWLAWGGGVVALLAIAGGGVMWWRKRTG
ncbi:MAG: hypothetical protein M0Z53_01825 [Thermaerobacter sp.]|nr:hypothetical protein [Thermaerobacter sp.]